MKRKNKKTTELNIIIVSHKNLPNPITDNLKIFFEENFKVNILHITHPLLDTKESFHRSSEYEYSKYKDSLVHREAFHWNFPAPFLYLKDLIYTFIWGLKPPNKWDLYFGVGNLNPICGIILRILGKVNKVIYYSMDYYPTRFKNKFLNWLYFQLDKFCVRYCDETWNVNSQMVQARHRRMGMNTNVFKRQYTVPGCIWFYKTRRLSFKRINFKKIVYRGSLLVHMGVDLAIRAIPLVLREVPDVIFEIIGTGKEEENLKKLAKNLGISKNILFHGFVESRKNMEKILSDGAVGVATFNTKILDNQNSDPGKIKDYMLLGMPIITTKSIPYSEEIVKTKSGIVIEYNVNALAAALIKLLKHKNLLKKYRQNVVRYIKKFDCSNILIANVERVLNE